MTASLWDGLSTAQQPAHGLPVFKLASKGSKCIVIATVGERMLVTIREVGRPLHARLRTVNVPSEYYLHSSGSLRTHMNASPLLC